MMAILDCRKQKGLVLSSIFKALMIPLAFVGLIGSAFIIYEAKEFGNLSIIPDKKQNMNHISVNLKTDLSEIQSTAVFMSMKLCIMPKKQRSRKITTT